MVHFGGLGGADVGGLGVELGNLGLDPGGWRAKGHSPVKECHLPNNENLENQLVFKVFRGSRVREVENNGCPRRSYFGQIRGLGRGKPRAC